MGHRLNRLVAFAAAGFATTVTSGCAGPSYIEDKLSSHYVFPNSNVEPVGAVTGEASKTSFTLSFNDPDLEQEAVRNALAKADAFGGADLIIDARYIWKTESVFFFLNTITVTVEGQAARVTEIGPRG